MEGVPPSSEQVSESEKFDHRWYGRFEALVFEDYEKLVGKKESREAEREKFLSGEVENPSLDYPELASFDLGARDLALSELKKDILEMERNEAVKKVYRTKINELLATVRMLKAAKERNDRVFSRYADFIYGKPEQDDIVYVVNHAKELAKMNFDSENPEKVRAAQRLWSILEKTPPLADSSDVDKSLFPLKGEEIYGAVESVDEIVTAFEEALSEVGASDWSVVVDSETGISGFSVSQEHKVVRIPSEEKLLARTITKKKLKALLEHEIKTHVARRTNGERSRLQLLGLGLDRYLKAEEGIATYKEQQVMGAKDFAGIPRFFSVALAKGLTGKPLDFRGTHTIMTDYRLLSSSKKEVTRDAAARVAYNDCVRIFRGTTCRTPGAVYSKDMTYFGNRQIWSLVSKNSEIVQSFSIGKYDPGNQEHVALLSQLGILDSDLVHLESSPED